MIRIGLTLEEKQAEIDQYLKQNEINKIFVFYPAMFPITFDVREDLKIEYIEYKDIIEYKPFYHLLEVIDTKTLLIFNECLRTQNRSDLTYNCAHHYANQTGHKIVFEYFPFIEQNADFMILLDLQTPGKYKGRSFDYQYLQEEDIKANPQHITLETIDLSLSAADIKKYEKKKEQLFDNLGNSEPDTIPRQLHVWAGNLKKSIIDPKLNYVARNARFKLDNVTTYKNIEAKEYILIDIPHRRIDFNDFLKRTDMQHIYFINSKLKVDLYYISELEHWIERLGEFYAKASLYK